MKLTKFILSDKAAVYSAAPIARELPEKLAFSESGIYIGKSKGYRIPVFLDLESLINPHISIIGTTGSGKTHLSKVLLAGYAAEKDCNIVVLDWNGEYCKTVEDIGGRICKIGDGDRISLFEAFKEVREALHFISEQSGMDESEQAVLYDLFLSKKSKRVSSGQISKCLDGIHKGGMRKKLGGIISLGVLEEGGIKLMSLFSGVVSIDLSALLSYEDKAFYSKMILKGMLSGMYTSGRKDGIERILILDEAWKHIANDNDIGKFFRESRKYGFGIIATSQLVSDLRNEIIGNSACFFVFKLQNDSDILALRSADIIGDYSPAGLNRGECILSISFKAYDKPYSAIIDVMSGNLAKVFCIRGGNMIRNISKIDLENMLRDYLEDDGRVSKVIKSVEAAGNAIDAEGLVFELKLAGLSRINILLLLSELGIDGRLSMDIYKSSA